MRHPAAPLALVLLVGCAGAKTVTSADAGAPEAGCETNEDCLSRRVGTGNDCLEHQCVWRDGVCAGATKLDDSSCDDSPPAPMRCELLPARVVVSVGSSAAVELVAYDAGGHSIALLDDVSFTADASLRLAVSGLSATVEGVSAGDSAIHARAGGVACAPARVEVLPAPPAATSRVLALDASTDEPIAGATVVVGSRTALTNSHGWVTTPAFTNATVSVFEAAHAYVTILSTSSRELVLRLEPRVAPAVFSGTMPTRSFDALGDLRGAVHVAFYGASLAPSLFDLPMTLVDEPSVETAIEFGNGPVSFRAPVGLVFGVGEVMMKPDYEVFARGDRPTFWSLGGNVDLTATRNALGPDLTGESINPSAAVQLVSAIGKLQSGVVADADGANPTLDGRLTLDTPLRLSTVVRLPRLPAPVAARRFDTVFLLAGALDWRRGLVPLGVSAGVDEAGPAGSPDGVVDANDGAPDGSVALRLAPPHGGLEGSRVSFVAFAMPMSPSRPYARSALVTTRDAPAYDPTGPAIVDDSARRFLASPEARFDGRAVELASVVDGATFERLDLADDAGPAWRIVGSAGATTIAIPEVPAGFDDRAGVARAVVHVVRLGEGEGVDDALFGFNRSALPEHLDAFASAEVVR